MFLLLLIIEIKTDMQIFQQKQNLFAYFPFFVQIANNNYLI